MGPTITPNDLDRAVACLASGGVVAFPTDTLYALGADALCPKAISRVLDIKHRPLDMGLPLLLADVEDLGTVAESPSEIAWGLARRFWPGALTLVVRKASVVPYVLTGGRDSVAVRVPDHPVALSLIRGLGRPVTGTSANITSGPDPTTLEQVQQSLGEACDLILDGGPAPLGVPSTIVDISGPEPRLIRAGSTPWEAVEAARLACLS